MVDGIKLKQEKLFPTHEVSICIDLVHWAMEASDIYSNNTSPNNQPKTSDVVPRTKEEKEVLENSVGSKFLRSFCYDDYMVERIHKNPSLQIIANNFLANPVTSLLFATALSEYFYLPVHLSSSLPYLPVLVAPSVLALNGSNTLETPLYDLIGHGDKVLNIDWPNPKYIGSGGTDTVMVYKS
uniref:Uncharacterized protein n=1 Tax=Glossina palpalis gambiensis TaxID=67801 RepID=A0A1B0C180_9MUSC